MHHTVVVYALYSGDMYGTERMAMAHLQALGDLAPTVILAPEGPVHQAAAALGIQAIRATGKGQVLRETLKLASRYGRVAFLSTSVTLAFVGLAAAALRPFTRIRHLTICHGGLEPERSFGNKRWLNRTPVRLVAVSPHCASQMQQFGVPAHRIVVLENFLLDARISEAPRRVGGSPPLQALLACRLVPVKRVDLLISALCMEPRLAGRLQVRVLGNGPTQVENQLREASKGLDIQFEGFRDDVAQVMAQCDVFVQTWADEPFGLAVVEAMAAGLVVVTPDRGGPAGIVGDDRHGIFYAADDPQSLAQALLRAVDMPAGARTAMREAAAARAMACYSASARREQLREVFLGVS